MCVALRLVSHRVLSAHTQRKASRQSSDGCDTGVWVDVGMDGQGGKQDGTGHRLGTELSVEYLPSVSIPNTSRKEKYI